MADNSLPKVAERSLPDAAMANVTHVRVVSTDNSEKLPIANPRWHRRSPWPWMAFLAPLDGAFEDVLIQIAGKADTTQVEALDAEKLDIANVYNALDKTVEGFALDARQGKALDDAMVHKTGNESIDGIKTFTSSPVVPTPTTDYQAATKAYADSLVVGLLDYRGGFDASVNAYPSSGGSGTGGAILKGDMWVVSVGGTIDGKVIHAGDSLIANVDTPAQTTAKWNTVQSNLTYVPEDVANKSTNVTTDGASDTKYPSVKAVKTYADGKVSLTGNETDAGLRHFPVALLFLPRQQAARRPSTKTT